MEVVSNKIQADKTEVVVGETVNFTGSVELDQAVQSAELVVDVYVNDAPVKTITASVSGSSASYGFQLVFDRPGTYHVKTYAQLHYLGYRAVVNVAGSLDGLAVIDTSRGVYLWFDEATGNASEKNSLPVIYTVVGYPNKQVCATVNIYNNGKLVKSSHVCADTETHAEIDLDPSSLSAGTLTVEAVPDDPSVQGDRSTWKLLDISGISVASISHTEDEIVLDIAGLPALPSDSGLWYEVEVGKTDPDLGFIVLGSAKTTGSDTGTVEIRITRSPSQGCICVNTVRIRLCSNQWYPTTCKPLLKEIRFNTVCIGPLCR